jgi:hypothetical protein
MSLATVVIVLVGAVLVVADGWWAVRRLRNWSGMPAVEKLRAVRDIFAATAFLFFGLILAYGFLAAGPPRP